MDFATKPDIALQQVRQTMKAGIKTGIVLADAAYGKGTAWREQLADWGLSYCVGVHEDLSVWARTLLDVSESRLLRDVVNDKNLTRA